MPGKNDWRTGVLALALIALVGLGCGEGDQNIVHLDSDNYRVHGGETAAPTATVTARGNPVPGSNVRYTSGAGGSVAPATSGTDGQIHCKYVITHNTIVSNADPRSANVPFTIGMQLVSAASPEGAVVSTSAASGKEWSFLLQGFETMTVELKGDGSSGGTAKWKVIETSPGVIGVANFDVAGPQQ